MVVTPIDYSKYPSNWKKEIVPRILDRADHKCEFCGVENKKTLTSIPMKIQDINHRYKIKRIWLSNESDVIRISQFSRGGEIKKVKVVLTVAHLDHDETNHDVKDDRLKALCQYCHLNYDAREKQRRIKAKSKKCRQECKSYA